MFYYKNKEIVLYKYILLVTTNIFRFNLILIEMEKNGFDALSVSSITVDPFCISYLP